MIRFLSKLNTRYIIKRYIIYRNQDHKSYNRVFGFWPYYKICGGVSFIFNYSRATSVTRTVFRLNTNQSHSYEDISLSFLNILLKLKIKVSQTYCAH